MKPKGFFVTGTGTGVGKTVASLGLCLHFKASYWKPIQTGQPGDAEFIKRFLPSKRVQSSVYEFSKPLSPNQAAEIENREIDLKKIVLPVSSFLIVEGIGGVHVPLNDKDNVMDLIKHIAFPILLVADSRLGTLNHSLLTLEVLQKRGFDVRGILLSGPKNKANKRDIEKWTQVPVLLEIPWLSKITITKLLAVYKDFKL